MAILQFKKRFLASLLLSLNNGNKITQITITEKNNILWIEAQKKVEQKQKEWKIFAGGLNLSKKKDILCIEAVFLTKKMREEHMKNKNIMC